MTKGKILGLRTTIYKVGDIQKARDWYTAVFEKEPYFEEIFYVGFDIGGYELGLQPEVNPTTEKPETVLTYWGVEDIHAEFHRFLAAGAIEHEAPSNVGGAIMVAAVKDPWGNIIGLIYNPDFRLEESGNEGQ